MLRRYHLAESHEQLLFFFLSFLLRFNIYEYTVAVFRHTRNGHHIPLFCLWATMWLLGTDLRSSGKTELLATEPSLPPLVIVLKRLLRAPPLCGSAPTQLLTVLSSSAPSVFFLVQLPGMSSLLRLSSAPCRSQVGTPSLEKPLQISSHPGSLTHCVVIRHYHLRFSWCLCLSPVFPTVWVLTGQGLTFPTRYYSWAQSPVLLYSGPQGNG